MENVTIKFKKLNQNAVIPTYAHDGDVGMDLTAIDVEYDQEKDMYIYHTGLACESVLWIHFCTEERYKSDIRTETGIGNPYGNCSLGRLMWKEH